MSTRLPFRIPQLAIYWFGLSYLELISSYVYGDMEYLLLSIIFFEGGCFDLLFAEPKLSRRASIALVTIGLCLYAPAPYLVLQGYIRPQPPKLLPIPLEVHIIVALTLAFLTLLIYIISYKLSKSN